MPSMGSKYTEKAFSMSIVYYSVNTQPAIIVDALQFTKVFTPETNQMRQQGQNVAGVNSLSCLWINRHVLLII